MKVKKYLFLLGMTAFLLGGAEFTIGSGAVKAVVGTKGAEVRSLTIGGKEIAPPVKNARTLTEKVLRNAEKTQIMEDFSALEFTPEALTADSITLSALGVRNFDFLRVTKKYAIDARTKVLTLTYTLTNISGRDQKAGLWIRTMLRRHNGLGMRNTYTYFRKGKEIKYAHPGNASGEIWITDATSATAAVMGNDDKTGAVLLFPQELACAYYSWFAKDRDEATLECFLREQPVPAGKSVTFDVKILLSENVPETLKKNANRPLKKGPGAAPVVLKHYAENDQTIRQAFSGHETMPRSLKTMDIRGRRQYCDSVRGVRIPGDMDPRTISVYQLANNSPEYDRPVPFTVEKLPSGEQRVLVLVPGVNEDGYYYTDFKGGFAYNLRAKKPGFAGPGDFNYRLCFDRGSGKVFDKALFAGGPQLILNGSFEQKMEKNPWPRGFNWMWYVRGRKFYYWVDDGPDKSKCLKIVRYKGATQYSTLGVQFRGEPRIKYTFSAQMRSENPDRVWSTCLIDFNDVNKKFIQKARIDVFNKKDSYLWQKVSRVFYMPEKADYGILHFGISRPSQTLWLDNISLVPEDFTYIRRSPMELLREEVKTASYQNLDFLESISHAVVTPHVKWLAEPVEPMPEILYLPLATTRSIQYSGKRQIVEFAQRMKLKYRFIPLLRKVESGAVAWDVKFGNTLESYTIAQLKAITKAPRIIIVQDMNFKTMVQPEFVEILKKFQQQGSGVFFYNCFNVPATLLGKKLPVPEEFFGSAPAFRYVGKIRRDRSCSVWQNGSSRVVCFQRNKSEFYLETADFACVPDAYAWEVCPSYYSCDFPYWEYIYVSALKALRYAAGVEPAVKAEKNLKQGVRLRSAGAKTVLLKVKVSDLHRKAQANFVQKAVLKPGLNDVDFTMPQLPGGEHVADYTVTDEQGRGFDFGAVNFTTPDPNKLAVRFADPEKIFSREGYVRAKVTVAGQIPAGAVLRYEAEDTRDRVVFRATVPAKAENDLTFKVLPPWTTLYRLRLSLWAGNREVSTGFAEFSMPGTGKDLTQLDALIWLGRTPFLKVAADQGFTMWVANFMQDCERMGFFKSIRNANMEPLICGAGHANYSTSLKYRGDIPSDPVRTPCYSDPGHWAKVEKIVENIVKGQRYRYYGVLHHEIADEAYLGSTVCYSPHCLKDFRAELKERYGSLDALNKGWERNFKRWDEVMPVQLKEVSGKDNLSPWLDHKMFMAKVFAKNWVGNTQKLLQKYVPGSKAGLSGTQVPGYSYDWVQLMKHITCLSYYGGIQRKVVHDLAAPGFVSGPWGGGYMKAELENEFYEKSPVWDNLLLGANMVSNFAGYCFNGDLTPVKNTLYYAEVIREIRGGIDRIVLGSREICRDVAVLYSQNSLFAAMGGIGGGLWHNAQTGWAALLEDLKFGYYYLSYEALDNEVPKARVVILPATVSLSPKGVKNLEKFVAAGGTVVADFAPGWYDEHGRKAADHAIEKLFGISRAKSALSVSTATISVKKTGSIPGLTGEFRLGEAGLAAAGAESFGDGRGFFINKLGKGRAVLLNILVGGYQEIKLGGVGGELQSVAGGAAVFCENLRKIMGGVLTDSGASGASRVTEKASKRLFPCTTSLRQDGVNYVFGIIKPAVAAPDGKHPMRFDRKFASDLQVKLPVRGHVYDVRKGKYLGYTDTLAISLIPGDGQIFAIQKGKTANVEVKGPEKAAPGTEVTFSFRAAGAVGPQVFRTEFFAPDGRKVGVYDWTGHFSGPEGKRSFQFAYNDKPGKWQVKVTHVNSGVTGTQSLTLK